jgi:hypothetical protein
LLRQDSPVSATPFSWHVSLRLHGRGPKIGDSDPAREFGGVTSVAGFSDAGGGTASLLEYYARAYHQTTEGGYAPITEAVLVFAITGIREDARRARADKEAVRDELEDAANRVSDLRTRLQRSELTAAALLDSLQRSQDASTVV